MSFEVTKKTLYLLINSKYLYVGRMGIARLGQWLNLILVLVCALTLFKVDGFLVRITYVNNAVAKGAGKQV